MDSRLVACSSKQSQDNPQKEDRSLVSSSSKLPLDYYGNYDFENGDEEMVVPIKWPTVFTLFKLLKEDGKTNIEKFTEALKKDSELCSFIKNYFNEGTQLVKEHATVSGVEESGNKEGTTIGETTKDVDQARDNWAKYLWSPRNPIEKLMQDHEFPLSIAERVGNDEELVAIAEKILEPFRQDSVTCRSSSSSSFNAQEYSQTMDLFLENNIFHKALLEELDEYPLTFNEILSCTRKYIAEPPEDRFARIKMNPSLGKVFEGGDGPVAKLCGAQSILFGYWASRDSLAKLAQRVDSPDLPKLTRREFKCWIEKS